MQEKKDTDNKMPFWVSNDLHKRVKVAASQKGMSIKQYVETAIERALEKNNIKP